MKKIVYTLMGLAVMSLASCSDDYTQTDLNKDFSGEKVAELSKFPESAMSFTSSLAAGSNKTMVAYNIAGIGIHEDFGQKSVDIQMDVMGQDFVFPSSNFFVYQYNYTARLEANGRTGLIYNYYAKLAHSINLVIKFSQETIPDYENSEIYARALAIRGFANFTQMRLFAWDEKGINYETIDEDGNLIAINKRGDSAEIYKMIEDDFLTAYNILQGKSNAGNKQYIDGKVAAGLLSRYYMFHKDWGKAKDYSLKALGGAVKANDFDLVDADGFAEISNIDVMWGFEIDGSTTTSYASYFSHMDTHNIGYGTPARTTKLIDARLAEQIDPKDKRRRWWYNGTDTIYNYLGDVVARIPKYGNLKFEDKSTMLGDYLYMRSTEMLLNYIESSFEDGDEGAAKAGLAEFMKTRMDGYSAENLSGDALRQEIRLQRRIELWGEGFALLDIKRWGIGMNRTSPVTLKDGTVVESGHGAVPGTKIDFPAGSDQFRFQFPRPEMNANLELRPQNP